MTQTRLLEVRSCEACKETGFYHFRRPDGVVVETTRTCFRCAGKGYQTEADVHRNEGYDRFAARRGVA